VQDLQIDKEYLPNAAVYLSISGKVNTATAGQFGWIFWGLFAQKCHRILLDLSKLASIDSTGIGVLVNAADTARENAGALVVLSPSPKVKWAMDTLCVTPLFTFAESREAGEKLVAGGTK
jgi:anti-anti-sigma factor